MMKNWLFSLLVLVVAMCAIDAAAEVHRCAVCKRVIDGGDYVEAGKKFYHKKHFRCASCLQPIRVSRYYERDGNLYDSACYLELYGTRCQYCGEPIAGDWALVSGRKYHDSCYTEHIAASCALCNRLLEGAYIEDFFGHKVHKSHKGQADQCEYCGRFISQEISCGSTIYTDGRVVCGICAASTVDTQAEADSLMEVVRKIMGELGFKVRAGKLDLYTLDKREMLAKSPPRGANAQAFTRHEHHTRLWGLLSWDEFEIYVLQGLPDIEFVATIAHELMHVWLGKNGPFGMDPVLAEGSCNYAAVLVLTRYGTDASYLLDKLIKDPDPVYGDGLRNVNEFIKANGFHGWLDYLKKNTAPPWPR